MSHQQAAKHGPAIDDALTDARHQTSAGTHHRDRPEDDPLGQPLEDEVQLRSELARFLDPSSFPADIQTLREHAQRHDATDTVLGLLDRVPDGDTVFATVEEVWQATQPG